MFKREDKTAEAWGKTVSPLNSTAYSGSTEGSTAPEIQTHYSLVVTSRAARPSVQTPVSVVVVVVVDVTLHNGVITQRFQV